MTQQQAESVKDLAKPVVETLGVVMERECPRCKGLKKVTKRYPAGVGQDYGQELLDVCPNCNGTGKVRVRWKWKPQNGSWYIWNNQKHPVLNLLSTCSLSGSYDNWLRKKVKDADPATEDITPILPWETIERVLEGVGYYLQINKPLDVYIEKGEMKVGCSIYQTGKDDFMVFKQSKTRQEAVMRSIIALGKKLTEDKHGTK